MGSKSISEYAAALGIPEGTLKRWIHEGMPVQRMGRRVAIDADTAAAWVREHHATSCSFKRQCVVYVARGRKTGRIKVGFSSDVKDRMYSLVRSFGEGFDLLASFDGDKRTENVLHSLLAPWRVGPELYAPIPEILAFVERVRTA